MTITSTAAQDFTSFVFADGETLKTNSRQISDVFGKKHFHVLRDIDVLLTQVSNDFGKSNFGCTDFIDKNGDTQRMYNLTKDGFVMLVMGYTGAAAMKIKESYINAFNFMHAKLSKPEKPFFKPQPYTTPLHPTMMTRKMKTHVQYMIDVSVHEKNQTTNKVVMDLARHFFCDSWELIPMKYYPEICAYFEVPAVYKVQSTNHWVMVEESKLGKLASDENKNAILRICDALDTVGDALDTLAFNV